jgi:predicted O-linked N-acetylglucosamine transferase (SPINDLY family)
VFTLNDEAVARLIHADGIHILLDLSGHTAKNRLPVFAWKPAPVQCTWLGFPTTTGVAAMDYILGDPIAIPPEDEGHFSEQVWRLPEIYLCLSAPVDSPNVGSLPALKNDRVTFASFNNLAKINDQVVACWARILNAVPKSRLLLKAKQLKDSTVLDTTWKRFAAHGIADHQLILEGTTPLRNDHLGTYQRVDIALDPFPYPGVTTSAEALWMGVPVLTLQGDRFLSRTAASIAHNTGMSDWIATREADYVDKAIRLSGDLPKLAALRAGLREQVSTSPLFDAPRFARHFEDALWGMWQARDKPPA